MRGEVIHQMQIQIQTQTQTQIQIQIETQIETQIQTQLQRRASGAVWRQPMRAEVIHQGQLILD